MAICPLSLTPFHLLDLYAESMQISDEEQNFFLQAKWFGVGVCLLLALVLQLLLFRQRSSAEDKQVKDLGSN